MIEMELYETSGGSALDLRAYMATKMEFRMDAPILELAKGGEEVSMSLHIFGTIAPLMSNDKDAPPLTFQDWANTPATDPKVYKKFVLSIIDTGQKALLRKYTIGQAYVERYKTDASGPEALIRFELVVRLRRNKHVGSEQEGRITIDGNKKTS